MKINIQNTINNFNTYKKENINNSNNNFNNTCNIKYSSKHVYAHNISNIHFGSRNINDLYDEYNWYINNDNTPAINAFLKIKADQKDMDSFLTAILNTDDRSFQFIDSLVKQPRNITTLTQKLTEKVGINSKNTMPFLYDSPYKKAYNKYMDEKYNNAHTISELLRVRPDWKGEVLLEKHHQLKGNDSFIIGSIPKEFPNEHLFLIADYLKDKMEIGFKQKKRYSKS